MTKRKGPQSKVNRRRITARARETAALEMRRQGQSYEKIAHSLGVTVSGAWRAVQRAYQRTVREADEAAEFNRALDLQRLDAVLEVIWPDVMDRRLGAVDRFLGILDRRARLLGLEAPQKQEMNIEEALVIKVVRDEGPGDKGDPAIPQAV
jgi:transposase-like protein